MSSAIHKAREAWGDDLPEWVADLAQECDVTSQARAARRIGRSTALVNRVLHRKYEGDLEAVARAVSGALRNLRVPCPALGEITVRECEEWAGKARHFAATNSQRVKMFRACRACPRGKGGRDGAR